MIDIPALRLAYEAEQPHYARLSVAVERSLREASRRAGLYHVEISSRAKDVRSFLRKAVRHDYPNPLEDIEDKAGVRVVIAFRHEEPLVEQLFAGRFIIVKREDKREELGEHEVGYLGLHLVVKRGRGPFHDMPCEVQVRTRAEDVWARLSHEVLYKAPGVLQGADRRQVLRLSALLELFDAEAGRTWDHFVKSDDYVAGRVVDTLERQLFRIAGRYDGDSLTSDAVKHVLLPVFPAEELQYIEPLIDDFVTTNWDKLTEKYRRYLGEERSLFLHRPEALLVFALLDLDPFALAGSWVQRYPFSELRTLAEVWGTPIDEPA